MAVLEKSPAPTAAPCAKVQHITLSLTITRTLATSLTCFTAVSFAVDFCLLLFLNYTSLTNILQRHPLLG